MIGAGRIKPPRRRVFMGHSPIGRRGVPGDCTRRRNRPIGSHSFSPTETRLFSCGKSPRAPAQSRTPQDQSRTSRRAEAIQGDEGAVAPVLRSEEHTSELQSLMRITYAVFCLKKK